MYTPTVHHTGMHCVKCRASLSINSPTTLSGKNRSAFTNQPCLLLVLRYCLAYYTLDTNQTCYQRVITILFLWGCYTQVDGSALGQHMEDFYLATLKEAVLAADPHLAERVTAALEAAAAKAGGNKAAAAAGGGAGSAAAAAAGDDGADSSATAAAATS